MNRLEEIREYIKNFICEKEQAQKQIIEIEAQIEKKERKNYGKNSSSKNIHY